MPQDLEIIAKPLRRRRKPKFGNTRQLFARLREALASGHAGLPDIAELVAQGLPADASVIYVARAGEVLEMAATYGLNVSAVGRTRLRVGEGIVGMVAASGDPLNLADAQNHPALRLPRRDRRRRHGRDAGHAGEARRADPRRDRGDVARGQAVRAGRGRGGGDRGHAAGGNSGQAGATEVPEEGFSGALPRRYAGHGLAPGIARGAILVYGATPPIARLLTDDPATELERLDQAVDAANKSLDKLISASLPGGNAPREVLEAYRMVAQSSGWLTQVRRGDQ